MADEQGQASREKINKYTWYHTIKVADGLYTDSYMPGLKNLWDFNLKCMENVDFKNKRVLDIGCRDGLFSFEAEKRGAREIIGIDNEISLGAIEFLIPLFKSKVKMYELNLYDLTPEKFGAFDIIIFLGVIYHLRFPFWGIKRITDCLVDGGTLLLEGGMLTSKTLEKKEFLYCPFEKSYYEASSCSFFNKQGLCTTMRSFNYKLVDFKTLESFNDGLQPANIGLTRRLFGKCKKLYELFKKNIIGIFRRNVAFDISIDRQFFIFLKCMKMRKNDDIIDKRWSLTKGDVESYWFSMHKWHVKHALAVYSKRNKEK